MGAWHARYAQQCGASICAVMDHDRAAARRLSAQFPESRAFTSVEELSSDQRPKVLHICTPLETHASLAQSALQAGWHVLSEKPLAVNTEISRELLSTAARNGLLLMPVHQFLFQAGFLSAISATRDLGTILHIDATFCSAGAEHDTTQHPDSIAAGILPHPLSLVERLVPGTLGAAVWTLHRTGSGEFRVIGEASKANRSESASLSLSILISLQGRPTECSMRIITSNGTVDLDLFHGFSLVDRAGLSRASKMAKPFRNSLTKFHQASWNLARRLAVREFAYPGLRNLISEFYAAVRNGSKAPISAEEVLAVAMARDVVIGQLNGNVTRRSSY